MKAEIYVTYGDFTPRWDISTYVDGSFNDTFYDSTHTKSEALKSVTHTKNSLFSDNELNVTEVKVITDLVGGIESDTKIFKKQ
jgi:hypothetical protein